MALQRIHTARGAMEAQFVCARLEEAGVAVVLLGDTLANASGQLPIGANAGPGIWVRPEEAARVLAILRQMQQSPPPARSARTPWVCPSCRESVEGQFTDCWNCGTSRFQESPTTPEPAADSVLATDLPCVRCGYDLRGLPAAHRCPECGLPILRSILDSLRDGVPEAADHLDTILRQLFAAAARSTNYSASLLMLVGHAWLQAWEPLDAADDAIDRPAVSGRDVCVALARCAHSTRKKTIELLHQTPPQWLSRRADGERHTLGWLYRHIADSPDWWLHFCMKDGLPRKAPAQDSADPAAILAELEASQQRLIAFFAAEAGIRMGRIFALNPHANCPTPKTAPWRNSRVATACSISQPTKCTTAANWFSPCTNGAWMQYHSCRSKDAAAAILLLVGRLRGGGKRGESPPSNSSTTPIP